MKKYHASKTILSYHDRSDGGAFVSLVEMSFASNTGISISLENDDVASFLFNEELGALIQVRNEDLSQVLSDFNSSEIQVFKIGSINTNHSIDIFQNEEMLFSCALSKLKGAWSEVSYRMAAQRDNPECAMQEFEKYSQDRQQR